MSTQNTLPAQHTPGPWQLASAYREESFEGFTFKRRAIYGTQSAVLIADVTGPEIRCEMRAVNEFRANARLIVTAPELLAALEAQASSLAICIESNTSLKVWREVAATNLKQARAAIARAKGGAA